MITSNNSKSTHKLFLSGHFLKGNNFGPHEIPLSLNLFTKTLAVEKAGFYFFKKR